MTGTDSDCVTFLDAVFDLGNFAAENDFGSDPGDFRSVLIAAVEADSSLYLDSAFPDGFSSWAGVFDMSFTPTN